MRRRAFLAALPVIPALGGFMVPGGIVKEIRDTVNAEFAARGLRDVMNRMENW